ncbi:MAG: DNA polymerase IV [Candidatus Eremiobacteraeota bacterium]|nr:DNA polymerase IV [Candidatus Eremiobacteraeota bacterium]MBC5802727.1 DNA polymerase IV [Candidatus Eremiobacteraeota bacterium]MBC5821575.1 DNA polymerase IV [Candidatus Eremiobacteraeota bacterium]
MIAHFDIDAFYASVAQRDDPNLRGKPLAVAGASRRAVVLTASYEARRYGVRSAMPLSQAKELCSTLLVSPPNFTRYRELSAAVFEIFARGGDAVEGLSLDEAFVALGSRDLPQAVAYAQGVRAAVQAEIGLTISAGVASGKMPAKIASDDAKPDGLIAIEPGREAAYLAPLPAGRLWGIGPKTQNRLAARGITTIGALAELSDLLAYELFGRGGKAVRELARGYDNRKVEVDRPTRSVSSEETFEYDIRDGAELHSALRSLSADVARRLVDHRLRGSTIGVKIKLSSFTIIARQTQLAVATDDAAIIERAALRCLLRAGLDGAAVRLLGVRVASITDDPLRELSLFSSDAIRRV